MSIIAAAATATATIPAGMIKIFNNHNLPGIVQQCLPHADETTIVPSDIRLSKADALALMGGRPCAASIAKGLLYYAACHASGSVRIDKSPEVAKLPTPTRHALFVACAALARGKGADAAHLRAAVEHGLVAMLALPIAVKKAKALPAPDAGEGEAGEGEAGEGEAADWLASAVSAARQAAAQFFGAADALGVIISAKQRAALMAISELDTPAKKAASAEKAAPAKKAASAEKAAPAKKAASAEKAATAKKVTA